MPQHEVALSPQFGQNRSMGRGCGPVGACQEGMERQQSACTKSTHDAQSPLELIFKRQRVGGWGQSWHQSSMLRLTIFWRRRCWVLSAAGICERRLFGTKAKQESCLRCTGICRVRRMQQGRRRRRSRRRRRGRSAECG